MPLLWPLMPLTTNDNTVQMADWQSEWKCKIESVTLPDTCRDNKLDVITPNVNYLNPYIWKSVSKYKQWLFRVWEQVKCWNWGGVSERVWERTTCRLNFDCSFCTCDNKHKNRDENTKIQSTSAINVKYIQPIHTFIPIFGWCKNVNGAHFVYAMKTKDPIQFGIVEAKRILLLSVCWCLFFS